MSIKKTESLKIEISGDDLRNFKSSVKKLSKKTIGFNVNNETITADELKTFKTINENL